MPNVTYDKQLTALLVIDPYNDFISEGGKLWSRLKAVAEANGYVRKAGLRVFYALHRRYRPGDYETWKYIAPIQKAAWMHKTFEAGTWGGQGRALDPFPGRPVTDAKGARDGRHGFSGVHSLSNQASTVGRGPGILVDVHSRSLPRTSGRLATTTFAERSRMDNLLRHHS